MNAIEIINHYWSVILGAIAFCVWLVRLESKAQYHDKLIDSQQLMITELKKKHEDLSDKVIEKLADIEKTVARIEGFLQNHKDCK